MTGTPDPIIRIDDVRKAGHCVSGARTWFRAHNLPFDDFLKNGIRASEFIERGDELSAGIVAKKIERDSNG